MSIRINLKTEESKRRKAKLLFDELARLERLLLKSPSDTFKTDLRQRADNVAQELYSIDSKDDHKNLLFYHNSRFYR
jgi:hypothetical protein